MACLSPRWTDPHGVVDGCKGLAVVVVQMMEHCVEDPPRSFQIFSSQEIKAIIDYLTKTYVSSLLPYK